jgi:hypothetical protein
MNTILTTEELGQKLRKELDRWDEEYTKYIPPSDHAPLMATSKQLHDVQPFKDQNFSDQTLVLFAKYAFRLSELTIDGIQLRGTRGSAGTTLMSVFTAARNWMIDKYGTDAVWTEPIGDTDRKFRGITDTPRFRASFVYVLHEIERKLQIIDRE